MEDVTDRNAAPGWYPDPTDPTMLRYWAGDTWTAHQARLPAHAPPPPPHALREAPAEPVGLGVHVDPIDALGQRSHPTAALAFAAEGQHARPPAGAPGTRPGAEVPRALTTWLQVLLWVVTALSLFGALEWFYAESAFQEWRAAPSRGGYAAALHWESAEEAANSVAKLTVPFIIGVIALLMVWMHKAHRATDALQPGPRRWTRGWTVGGWFIPVAQWFIPASVLTEIEQIASANRREGQVTTYWRNSPRGRAIYVAFGLWGAAVIMRLLGTRQLDPEASDLASSLDSVSAGYFLLTGAALLAAGACAITAVRIKRISRLLPPASVDEATIYRG